jgi:hypothetical protein
MRALVRRFPDASFLLCEIAKRGALRLGSDGTVAYTGEVLDQDTLRAVALYERDVRITLGQRWFERVLLPAPEPSAAATVAAA